MQNTFSIELSCFLGSRQKIGSYWAAVSDNAYTLSNEDGCMRLDFFETRMSSTLLKARIALVSRQIAGAGVHLNTG